MKSFSVFLVFLALSQTSYSYELGEGKGYLSEEALSQLSELTLREAQHPTEDARRRRMILDGNNIRKFEVALKALNVPLEPNADFSQFPASGSISEDQVIEHLPLIDPSRSIRQFLNLTSSSLTLYQDIFTNLLPPSFIEYSTLFNDKNKSYDSMDLLTRLNTIASQLNDPNNLLPLTGLKIALDPGHMGTHDWDIVTGKYARVNQNSKREIIVSEGAINLWTALLLAKKFEALGATVQLTHTTLGTVSNDDPDHFDLTPYLNNFYYESFEDPWMTNLFHLSDEELAVRVKKVAAAHVPSTPATIKDQFFVSGSELEARSIIIDQFHPDLTLDIHYDAIQDHQEGTLDRLQSASNSIEAFIPGGFLSTETGSKKLRNLALKQLLDINRWNESVSFSSEIVQAMSKSLDLPLLDEPTLGGAYKVKDGVYARNLHITRRATEGLMAYIECLHYDHVSEFYRFTKRDRSAQYHDQPPFNYPSRIDDVVTGIATGVLNYLKKGPAPI